MYHKSDLHRILVIGSDGVIGNALLSGLTGNNWEAAGTTRRKGVKYRNRFFFDLAYPSDISGLLSKFNVVIICAGISGLLECEEDPAGSHQINVHGTLCLIEAALSAGAYVVFFSSNQVFSGDVKYPVETDHQNPITEYGRQKAEVEFGMRELKGDMAILRLTKVLAPDTGILAEWRQKLKKGRQIFPFSDLMMAPIHINDILHVLEILIRQRTQGIYHLSGDRDISYAEAAHIGANAMKVRQELVIPVLMPQSMRETSVPFTALNAARLKSIAGIEIPDVADTIQTFFMDW